MDEKIFSLPVEKFKIPILESIEKNPVTIITAETGAGKSTRIPFWLWENGKKVIVTQPRRIAARSLSYYLSDLNRIQWGMEIGYQTGFDRKKSKKTELLYLTDGVQLVNEIKGHINYDILIIDEVHEWNLNQEVLVGLVKKRIKNNFYIKRQKRVVIMSATIEAKQLSIFLDNAPVISVPGRGFPVTLHNNSSHFLLSDTISMAESGKNCLVFLPGKKEISDFITLLKETLKHDKTKAVILPLHSELNVKQQSKVFKHYEVPKIIVSTDIAQTSLTIDDIDAVIDNGIKKEIRTIKGIEGLYPVEISRSESLQRAGRAGRVKNGYYILCSDFPNEERDAFPEPEIRRLNLESSVLKLIKWGIDPSVFPYFHSPKRNLIKKAAEKLRIAGAIDKEGKITNDGKIMADLPISIRGARLLLEILDTDEKIIDSGLKIIALIETKGIAGRDYVGEKIYPDLYGSDLLNQLYLWNSYKKNKKIINIKKFEMAKEIYRELKKRISVKAKTSSSKDKQIKNPLFRAILSSFSDNLFIRSGKNYFQSDEERQLDRNSILFKSMPEMVVALPFDLTVESENRFTGEKEKHILKLLTFSTEVSLQILNELKPFGYLMKEEITIDNGIVSIKHIHFFGEKKISEEFIDPQFKDKTLMNKLTPKIVEWWRENCKKFDLFKQFEELKPFFLQAKKISGEKLSDFQFYIDSYLKRKISDTLNTKDLSLYFSFHKGFTSLKLSDILPESIISILKKKKWPEYIFASGEKIIINYFKGKPYLVLSKETFEKLSRNDLILQTGLRSGVVIGERRFADWDYAVYHFNREKRSEIFRKKWKKEKKEANPDDLTDIEFPVSFIGGKGMDKEKFTFFSVPEIKGDKVFLKHFFERDEAEKIFSSIKDDWENFLANHKIRKIKDIFHNKGWKVK